METGDTQQPIKQVQSWETMPASQEAAHQKPSLPPKTPDQKRKEKQKWFSLVVITLAICAYLRAFIRGYLLIHLGERIITTAILYFLMHYVTLSWYIQAHTYKRIRVAFIGILTGIVTFKTGNIRLGVSVLTWHIAFSSALHTLQWSLASRVSFNPLVFFRAGDAIFSVFFVVSFISAFIGRNTEFTLTCDDITKASTRVITYTQETFDFGKQELQDRTNSFITSMIGTSLDASWALSELGEDTVMSIQQATIDSLQNTLSGYLSQTGTTVDWITTWEIHWMINAMIYWLTGWATSWISSWLTNWVTSWITQWTDTPSARSLTPDEIATLQAAMLGTRDTITTANNTTSSNTLRDAATQPTSNDTYNQPESTEEPITTSDNVLWLDMSNWLIGAVSQLVNDTMINQKQVTRQTCEVIVSQINELYSKPWFITSVFLSMFILLLPVLRITLYIISAINMGFFFLLRKIGIYKIGKKNALIDTVE